ncbi:hypothetical protein [Lacihabitans lacunae]|jgi:hypothetical protein|uniref:Uncharacterized protein n=1 Tax=Lacihabitans lacunae TaxID=1028214 RepID=A0ABV7Z391_9BACT
MDIEDFQNDVLRPIIKSLHDFIIQIADESIEIKPQKVSEIRDLIEQKIKSDYVLKNILIGAVLSKMSTENLKWFFENRKESSKRISNIISKRIFDTYYPS